MVARIALNALALTPEGTGVQTYIRELLRALSNQTQAELVAVVQDHVVEHLPVGVHPRPRPRSNGAVRALHGLRSFPGADLIHGLDVDLPLRTEAPTVATVHDLSVFDAPWAHPGA